MVADEFGGGDENVEVRFPLSLFPPPPKERWQGCFLLVDAEFPSSLPIFLHWPKEEIKRKVFYSPPLF